MNSIKTAAELKIAIEQLEHKHAAEWPLLKNEFRNTYESLKLINIIKSTFKEAVTVPDLKTNVINAAIGLTTGMVAKKIMLGKTLNPFARLLGLVVEIAIAGKVTKNADGIRSVGSLIMNKLFAHKTDSVK